MNDLQKLQGTWHVTSLVADGQRMPGGDFDDARIVIQGNAFTSVGMGAAYEGTLELDQSKKPKTFSLIFTAGHAAGTRNRGIYKLAGDRWTICLATRGNKRPTTFAAESGTGFALETLERGVGSRKTQKRESPSQRSAGTRASAAAHIDRLGPATPTELEGEWKMVAAVLNGAALGPDMIKWCTRVTRGDVTTVAAGPQVMLRAAFTLDHSATPKRIDYMNIEGAHAGKPQAGIFELIGDTLQICMSAPNGKRPGTFSSKSGDGRSHTIWHLVGK